MKASQIFDELIKEMSKSFEGLLDSRTEENVVHEIKDAALGDIQTSSW